MAIYHHTTRMIGRSQGGSPVKALAYISGIQLTDERTGEVWDFKDKSIQSVQILLPEDAPMWAKDLQKLVAEDPEKGLQLLSDMANRAEKRADAQVYREVEFSLPRELTHEQNKALTNEYVQDQFCGLGMLAIQSFHTEMDEKTGELNPHCHTFFLTRELVEGDLSHGLSEKKNRDWNERDVHEVWREQWAQYASFHLKMHGFDITLDHRSYKDQGLDIEPQIKLGKGVKEQEKRGKKFEEKGKSGEIRESVGEKAGIIKDGKQIESGLNSRSEMVKNLNSQESSLGSQGFIESIPKTDRVQELRSIQLRNLYRIMRRPETVLDIVTRHHATFMWGDVQKVLGRYVDEVELFQRLDARLRNSHELILLKVNGVKGQDGHIEERAIYTTRGMLKAEKELVSTAEALAALHTHSVSSSSLEGGLERLQARLQKEGHELSEGQETAIRHLVDDGQLKCIVGYAGAGKTTALEACRDIWEDSGYKVYGLAPTGRAAQNLEGSGIASQTLHRFLKSFDEGRCQYSAQSILVLDEAGMVDVERFERFLGAVQYLGVKAVVVGDSGQLQPVEAGPAFRLVTERAGVSRLEEVVRQKEGWQREATVLFGQQESQLAIQVYQERGHVHLIDEPLSGGRSETDEIGAVRDVIGDGFSVGDHAGFTQDPKLEFVFRYEMAARMSGLIFREIMKDLETSLSDGEDKEIGEERNNETERGSEAGLESETEIRKIEVLSDPSHHQDYPQFLKWRSIQRESGKVILGKADDYREILEARSLDPLEMARLFVSKKQDKSSQYQESSQLLKAKKLDHLMGRERAPSQGVDVRKGAKAALIEDWRQAYQMDSHKSLLMMAYSNRDVWDLNAQARSLLQASGVIEKKEMTYTIVREVEDDFGRRKSFKETRSFSKGDRLVFTRNKQDLGVKNGSIGTILSLESNRLEVEVDSVQGQGHKVVFSPQMFPFFDQGWAVTIHKSQGTTVDKSFLLASHEMNQNLTYVAMTRHREDVYVYGSTLDFWRPEKVPEILSKSGEKLGAADYLDSHSLSLLMKEEDRFLNKLFTRLSDELQAMGAVSKRAFEAVADHFLGRISERERILLKPEIIREEVRAQEILQKLEKALDLSSSARGRNDDGPGRQEQGPKEQIEIGMGAGAGVEVRPKPEANVEAEKERGEFYPQGSHEGHGYPHDLEFSVHTLEERKSELFNNAQGSHSDFQDSITQQRDKINTLQDVYEDWKHPAFNSADFYKRVFEKALSVHGEEASVQYWKEKREPYMRVFEQKIERVEKELESPLLSYLSDESRVLARKAALEDPDRALTFLSHLQEIRKKDQHAQEKALQEKRLALKLEEEKEQARQENFKKAFSHYFRFKDLSRELEKYNDFDLKKEQRALGKSLYKNKEIFEHIEKIDPEISKAIKESAQEKQREYSRGGFSL
jgi:ATP-dependent exoDNAse (exonuclease V) alpha subunit